MNDEWKAEINAAQWVYFFRKEMLLYFFPFVYLFYIWTGQYSCLLVDFHLQRHMGNFLIQVYGPCTLLVVLSWVSFWLNREATADRVSLGKCSLIATGSALFTFFFLISCHFLEFFIAFLYKSVGQKNWSVIQSKRLVSQSVSQISTDIHIIRWSIQFSSDSNTCW